MPAIREIPGTTRAKPPACETERVEPAAIGYQRIMKRIHDAEDAALRREARQSLAPVGALALLMGAESVVALLSRRRRVLHRCELPLFPPERDLDLWICASCDAHWRWNPFGEWWEEL